MPKRILLVYAKNATELLNRQSALGSYIYVLCSILEKGGYQIQVNEILFSDLKQQNISLVVNPVRSSSKFKKILTCLKFFKNILNDIVYFRSLDKKYRQIVVHNQFDYILEFYTYGSNIGYKLSKETNKPLVVVYDAPVLEEYEFFHGKKYFFKKKILKRQSQTLKKANHVITYSNAVKKHLEKLLGFSINSSIHQDVDFTRFEFVENKQLELSPIYIGFIGSFLKWHKTDSLVNAYNRLRDEGINAKLLLIGNGMEFAAIKEKVNVSKYESDIQMTGFVSDKELYEYKKRIQIGVMPGSNWYGAPIKIFEYGAACMAVVAPATPTIAELFVDKNDLLLFDEANENGLYHSLKILCEDSNLRARFAKNLQNKIAITYSEQSTFNYYNSIFVDITSNSCMFKN